MLLLDERIRDDGTHVRAFASLAGDRVEVRDEDGARGVLSVAALDRVMVRYGRALEAPMPPPTPTEVRASDVLELPGGYRLRRMRFHAIVDAEGRDYLVWERPEGEPLAAIATMVTAALRYLVLRLAGVVGPSGN